MAFSSTTNDLLAQIRDALSGGGIGTTAYNNIDIIKVDSMIEFPFIAETYHSIKLLMPTNIGISFGIKITIDGKMYDTSDTSLHFSATGLIATKIVVKHNHSEPLFFLVNF